MSFHEQIKKYRNFDFEGFFSKVTDLQIESALAKDRINSQDFLALLSPKAEKYLEAMAQKAHDISLRNFGKSIGLYTPMYLANYCMNKCAYCGYNVENHIARKKLSFDEVENEAKAIAATGLKHILILTGESEHHTPVSYIKECVKIMKRHFDSISIEIYPLKEEQYAELVEAGVDGLTVYQETYNEKVYDKVHISGPKKNYAYRLEAPERGCRAGIHSLGIGALLGLHKWREDAFFTGLHAEYIEQNYPWVELSMGTPRIRPHAGSFTDICEVTDANLVQAMLAYKIFIQRAGLNITTRESAEFRNNLIPLGVAKMSAGVSTEVGGHSNGDKGEEQFEIADGRSVDEISQLIRSKGYEPVFKDWQQF